MREITGIFWKLLEFLGFFDPETWLGLAVVVLVCLALFAVLLALLHLPKWTQRIVGAVGLLAGGWTLGGTFKFVLANDSKITGPMIIAGLVFGTILVLFGGTFCLFPVSPEKIWGQTPNNG